MFQGIISEVQNCEGKILVEFMPPMPTSFPNPLWELFRRLWHAGRRGREGRVRQLKKSGNEQLVRGLCTEPVFSSLWHTCVSPWHPTHSVTVHIYSWYTHYMYRMIFMYTHECLQTQTDIIHIHTRYIGMYYIIYTYYMYRCIFVYCMYVCI